MSDHDEEGDEGLRLLNAVAAQAPEDWGWFVATAQALQWLCVLAAPHLFRALSRVPPRDHLLRMVDSLIDYARRDERCSKPEFESVPYARREALARELRVQIESWTPPDLPEPITAAARALLYAEGRLGPGGNWDNLQYDGEQQLEDVLAWPAARSD